MKKYLFAFFFSLILLPSVFAASSFSHPVLQKVYEQVNLSITQKTDKITLDENSRVIITQKKEQLVGILVAIDNAVKKRDKWTIILQVKLFREKYKETIDYIQNIGNNPPTWDITKVQINIENIKITGTPTEITYYADFFEWRNTSNGNVFSQAYYSAARCDIPFNTLLQVGKGTSSIIVKVNDRPNCSKYPNVTDLSKTAFGTVGKLSSGRLQWTFNTLGTVSKSYIKETLPSATFADLWISLSSHIPNTYLKNETFHITGKELLGNDYIILYLKSPSWKELTLGAKKQSDNTFEFNSSLEEIGTYQMVIASWLSFDTSTFLSITVLDDHLFSAKALVSPTKTPEKLESLDVERVELPDLTSEYLFRFSSPSFHTLTISNSKKTVVYRGFSTISIKSDALKSFDLNENVSVEVTSEESSTPFSHDTFTNPVVIFNKIMTLTPGYKEEKNENITVTEENGKLVIHGLIPAWKQIKNEIMLTLPNGNVEQYVFDTVNIDTDGFLKRDKVFEKIIPLEKSGLYLVELNYENGFAAYNGPVIYGDYLPILPNDYDNIHKDISNSDSSIVATESLKFVNNIRSISGKSALSLDSNLTNLAIIKANNMAIHNSLSHTDSYGGKINDTAKRNNIKITGSIGENIAGGNINFRVLLVGLANSGGHRANMLESWTKIGIGYAVKNGQVYYAQVFGE